MSVVTLAHRMREDMQLRGFAPRTQESYLSAVNGLAVFCGRPRDALEAMTEDDVRRFFLHLVTERQSAVDGASSPHGAGVATQRSAADELRDLAPGEVPKLGKIGE